MAPMSETVDAARHERGDGDAGAELHPNIARVVAAATRAGMSLEPSRFPAGTRTAEDAARAIGCQVGQIVKSLVFMVDGAPIVALVSGADRVDTARLAGELGAHDVRRATGDEARDATGFTIGGIPPLGHSSPVPAVIDRRLLRHAVVWAAAGLPDAVFPAAPEVLASAAGARAVDIAATAPPGSDSAR